MLFNLALLPVYFILWAYGGLSALLGGNSAFNYDEIQKRFFTEGSNFQKLMQRLSTLSDLWLGKTATVRFIKIHLLLLFFFVVALVWYGFNITGFGFLFGFFQRGLTLNLAENERNYLLHSWPWYFADFSRNSGSELYVGQQFVDSVILFFALLLLLSVASSLSLQNSLTLIRRLSVERIGLLNGFLQILSALCVGALIDVCFMVVVFIALLTGGRYVSVSLEETFNANISQRYLLYGYAIVVGKPQIGSSQSQIGIGIGELHVDFEKLGHNRDRTSQWVHLIFPSPILENDVGKLCRRFDLASRECAGRLRSLYFERVPRLITILKIPVTIASQLFKTAASFACGGNLWSSLISGNGVKEAFSLTIPWFAALAVVLLSRFLIFPLLLLILFSDFMVVKLGKYAALSSERGLVLATQYGRVLLGTPPIIAIALLAKFARWIC